MTACKISFRYNQVKSNLNCPCHLYTIGCTIEPLILWYIQKFMLIWKFCFFILVLSMWSVRQKWRRAMLRATDSRKRCSRAWIIFNSRDPFISMTELLLLCIFVIRNSRLNYFLPIPSHSMWKDRASRKLSKRESTFSLNQSHGASSFLTNRSHRQNLK